MRVCVRVRARVYACARVCACVCVRVCVCVSSPVALNNYWHDVDPVWLVKQVSSVTKFYQ